MDARQLDTERTARGSGAPSRAAADDPGRDETADHAPGGATSGASQGDALRPLFGQEPDVIGGHLAPDGGTPVPGPPERTDVGPLHGGGQDPATGGSDLGPTTGGGGD